MAVRSSPARVHPTRRLPSLAVLVTILGLLSTACGDDSPDQRTGSPSARDTPAPSTPTPTPTATPEGDRKGVAWTYAKVLERLAGHRLRVDGRRVQIDPQTVTCGGVGRPASRKGGKPAWTSFRCVQPTFPARSVAGPDAILIVEPTGRRSFAVTSRRLTRY
jgi:hypothetical protein